MVLAYAGLLAWTGVRAVGEPDLDRSAPMSDDAAIKDLWFRPTGKEVELQLPD